MRLKEYAHQIEVVLRAVADEHRPAILAWIHAHWDRGTGEELDVEPRIDLALICEDCPDAATLRCETCPTPRAILDDTEVLNE